MRDEHAAAGAGRRGEVVAGLALRLDGRDGRRAAAIFTFDERLDTILTRAAGMGLPVKEHVDAGNILIQPVDPGELSPGEFASAVRQAAENGQGNKSTRVVVIDSINSYMNAMPEERFLEIQLHELLTYLGHKGIVTFLIAAQHGFLGEMRTPIDTSYLADLVILLRYFEAAGSVPQAISVLKKRTGPHERGIRELWMDNTGLHVGEPLRNFQGVLTGNPSILGSAESVMRPRDE